MAAPTAEQLATMPIDQLEQMLMEESEKLSSLLATGGAETLPAMPAEAPMDIPMEAPMDAPMAPPPEELAMPMEEEAIPEMSVSPIMNPEVPLDMLSPDIIQSATSALAEAGFLDKATDSMSPELIQVLQGVADLLSPGIYNLNTDEDLMEFVNGIANGTVPITALSGPPAGGAGPDTGLADPGIGAPAF